MIYDLRLPIYDFLTFYSPWLHSVFVAMNLFEKTKPIYSYCVVRDAYCEMESEKTKPVCHRANRRNILFERWLWDISVLWGKKTNPIFLAPSTDGALKRFEKTKPMLKWENVVTPIIIMI